ncbi:putative ankyrin repeat-containing domain-containing protein [Helianthus annuus]|nr:putative ankyrin repeat-containing domain-containing protein [Helianthus annuus]
MFNLKTALHSCARQGHLEVVKAIHQKVPGIVARADKKGQTALHMAVRGQNVEVVNALIEADNGLINMVDKQGNTALHITTRKGRTEIVCALLNPKGTINKQVINKYGETPLDTAEKFGRSEIAIILQKHGVPKARSIKNTQPPLTPTTRELKQTVSDIKHGVHVQLEHAINSKTSQRNRKTNQ